MRGSIAVLFVVGLVTSSSGFNFSLGDVVGTLSGIKEHIKNDINTAAFTAADAYSKIKEEWDPTKGYIDNVKHVADIVDSSMKILSEVVVDNAKQDAEKIKDLLKKNDSVEIDEAISKDVLPSPEQTSVVSESETFLPDIVQLPEELPFDNK